MERANEKLKMRIVARKYFQEMQPNFLTYVEKEQIRNLHKSDPVEYTPEKLSESFPSLPQTIRKILKSKWTPSSADRVIKHDESVIENWKKLKRGELPLEPRLREHLRKFKGRTIRPPKREEIEKSLIPPPVDFPKPKSQLYSGLIQAYLDSTKKVEADKVETRLSLPERSSELGAEKLEPDDLMNRLNTSVNDEALTEFKFQDRNALRKAKEDEDKRRERRISKSENEIVTLDKFFENKVKNIGSDPSLEDRVLMDTYKRNKESKLMGEKNSGFDDRLSALNIDPGSKSGSVTVEREPRPESIRVHDESKEMGLKTYVKAWEKKESQDEMYPEFINIPKDKYKKGKIYQLRDCYYDNDGEFLYRVPGLKE